MRIDCNCLSMMLAARRTEALFDQAFAPIGLPAEQFSLLLMVCDIGPVDHASLARTMLLGKPALKTALRPMRDAGWVEQIGDGSGNDSVWRATPAGRRLLKRADRYWKAAQDALERSVGEQRVVTLRQTLSVIRSADFDVTDALPETVKPAATRLRGAPTKATAPLRRLA
jgi:DNA-binding MarR family transcriptional regulator